MKYPLPIGTKTQWGTIVGIRYSRGDGERYYFLQGTAVAFMPASLIEEGRRS